MFRKTGFLKAFDRSGARDSLLELEESVGGGDASVAGYEPPPAIVATGSGGSSDNDNDNSKGGAPEKHEDDSEDSSGVKGRGGGEGEDRHHHPEDESTIMSLEPPSISSPGRTSSRRLSLRGSPSGIQDTAAAKTPAFPPLSPGKTKRSIGADFARPAVNRHSSSPVSEWSPRQPLGRGHSKRNLLGGRMQSDRHLLTSNNNSNSSNKSTVSPHHSSGERNLGGKQASNRSLGVGKHGTEKSNTNSAMPSRGAGLGSKRNSERSLGMMRRPSDRHLVLQDDSSSSNEEEPAQAQRQKQPQQEHEKHKDPSPPQERSSNDGSAHNDDNSNSHTRTAKEVTQEPTTPSPRRRQLPQMPQDASQVFPASPSKQRQHYHLQQSKSAAAAVGGGGNGLLSPMRGERPTAESLQGASIMRFLGRLGAPQKESAQDDAGPQTVQLEATVTQVQAGEDSNPFAQMTFGLPGESGAVFEQSNITHMVIDEDMMMLGSAHSASTSGDQEIQVCFSDQGKPLAADIHEQVFEAPPDVQFAGKRGQQQQQQQVQQHKMESTAGSSHRLAGTSRHNEQIPALDEACNNDTKLEQSIHADFVPATTAPDGKEEEHSHTKGKRRSKTKKSKSSEDDCRSTPDPDMERKENKWRDCRSMPDPDMERKEHKWHDAEGEKAAKKKEKSKKKKRREHPFAALVAAAAGKRREDKQSLLVVEEADDSSLDEQYDNPDLQSPAVCLNTTIVSPNLYGKDKQRQTHYGDREGGEEQRGATARNEQEEKSNKRKSKFESKKIDSLTLSLHRQQQLQPRSKAIPSTRSDSPYASNSDGSRGLQGGRKQKRRSSCSVFQNSSYADDTGGAQESGIKSHSGHGGPRGLGIPQRDLPKSSEEEARPGVNRKMLRRRASIDHVVLSHASEEDCSVDRAAHCHPEGSLGLHGKDEDHWTQFHMKTQDPAPFANDSSDEGNINTPLREKKSKRRSPTSATRFEPVTWQRETSHEKDDAAVEEVPFVTIYTDVSARADRTIEGTEVKTEETQINSFELDRELMEQLKSPTKTTRNLPLDLHSMHSKLSFDLANSKIRVDEARLEVSRLESENEKLRKRLHEASKGDRIGSSFY